MTMIRRLGAATLLLAALLLMGCGGRGNENQVASLSDDGTTATTDSDGGGGRDDVTDEEAEQAMLDFAQCMRDHGIDMPDPDTSGRGGGPVIIGPGGGEGGDGDQPDMDEFEAADEACRHLIEGVLGSPEDMSPEEQAEMQDQMLAMAQCMRDHGIDMPDPEFDQGGGGGIVEQELSDIDPSSDEFQDAQEACNEELGVDGGPGGGPTFGYGPGGSDERGPSTDSSDEGEG
jgi:hypothetical protein